MKGRAPLHRMRQGGFVGEFESTAHGDTMGDPAGPDAPLGELTGEVQGGSLTLRRCVGRDNNFLHGIARQSGVEPIQAKF